MTKLFACFALFCLIGTAFCDVGDACVTNPLLVKYDFDMEDEEVSGTAFAYCKSLQEGTSCCAASIVAGFQDKMDTLAESLIDAVVKRDKAIVLLRDETIPSLSEDLETLKTNAAAALATIETAIDAAANPPLTPEDESTVEPYSLEEAQTLTTNLETLAENAAANLEDITTGFTAFQKARSLCVVELLGLQAAAWCLACDPTAAEQGVADGPAITLADETCTRLKGACYDYVAASVTQSDVLSVGWISAIIEDLNTALEAVAEAADEAALQGLADAVQPAEDDVDTEAQPVSAPTGCTEEDDCNWICTGLFVEGEIVQELIVLGGTAGTPLVETTAVVAAPDRRLQDTWAPAADESGLTIEFPDDPANINSDDDTLTPAGASIIKTGFVCVIALLSVFFF